LLTSAEIPYKITGELRPAYHYGGRHEIGSSSNIMVLKKDTASAILVCNELIQKAKELEKKVDHQRIDSHGEIYEIF